MTNGRQIRHFFMFPENTKAANPYGMRLSWSWWSDSNRRPADYKSAALPTELYQPILFGDKRRFSISTPCMQGRETVDAAESSDRD